jgi:hypothetical protein
VGGGEGKTQEGSGMLVQSVRYVIFFTLLLVGGVSSARAQELADVLDRVRPAVVTIEASGPEGKSAGTGFVVREDGVILTAAHVVKDARRIRVRFADGRTLTVEKVLQEDEDLDFAVLQIGGEAKFATIPLGNSDKLRQGERVIALGNPLGMFDFTASEGIISALRNAKMRAVTPDSTPTYVQTTAAISRGNSGGPIFNFKGEAIGIAVFKAKDGENLNFALAINQVKPFLNRVGKLVRPSGSDAGVATAPTAPRTLNESWFLIASEGGNNKQVYNIFNVEDPLDSDTAKKWVQGKWEQGYQITEVATGDKRWVIMMSKGVPYSNTNLLSEARFPKARVEELREQDRYVSSVRYGQGRWVVVMSEFPKVKDFAQEIRAGKEFPSAWVREKMAAGYRVTAVDNDREQWVVVMTRGTGGGEQVFKVFAWGQLPEEWIKSQREEGYFITHTGGGSTPDGEPMAVMVMSKGVEYTNQVYWFGKEFPRSWIQEKWEVGWDITAIR